LSSGQAMAEVVHMIEPDWIKSGHPSIEPRLIVGVSGGKDSTATCLHLMELGYAPSDFDRVFMDTGWESPEVYIYLDRLESLIGPIHRINLEVPVPPDRLEVLSRIEEQLGHKSPMVREVLRYLTFPNGLVRWCTRKLKMEPLLNYLNGLDHDVVNVVGIRGAESQTRAAMPHHEWSDGLDCWVWRPLMDWSLQDVIDIHTRWQLEPNPMYFAGSARVGCHPCIYARKGEIRTLAETDPDRIDLIRLLENEVSKLAGEERSFFKSRVGKGYWNIDRVVEWSKTKRGGRQFEMFAPPQRDGGCVRWGMCDVGVGDE
jgi:3'-phosphoadenosine 5'-phosphosulfate sulfotransferase (PAPS reductase)/FAD synthetase